MEVKRRRGRPPKIIEGIGKDQPRKAEKMQASPISGGGHPGATTRGVTAGNSQTLTHLANADCVSIVYLILYLFPGSPPVNQEEVKEEAQKKPEDVCSQ